MSATERFRKVAEAAATAAINLARPDYFSSSEKGNEDLISILLTPFLQAKSTSCGVT